MDDERRQRIAGVLDHWADLITSDEDETDEMKAEARRNFESLCRDAGLDVDGEMRSRGVPRP